MWIDVRIPFDENNRLAEAYNRALQESTTDWVLFLDHDVFLCNPHWYSMCLYVIENLKDVDDHAACIGCKCGGSHHKRTVKQHGPPESDIEKHIAYSKKVYHKYGNMVRQIHEHAAGYFLLLNRQIATEIGFRQVKNSINNIDQDFGSRLLEAGYHIYEMEGLYIYHRRGMKHLKKEFTIGYG